MKILHVDHIGITVNDIDAAGAFFVDLGFTEMGRMPMEGEFVEGVIGLKDVKSQILMLEAPDGQLRLELSQFDRPVDPEGVQSNMVNVLGLRHISFIVDDLDGVVAALKQKGHKLVGEMRNYKNTYKLCYIRGPEEILVELAEEL
jgi:catechol 2,3-dioxygenase-like lactoylglutathione lyase family enzyme